MITIAVCGPARATPEELRSAAECGRAIARSDAVLVCGGLGGVMDAAAEGASEESGLSIGLLPGESRKGASPHLSLAIPTGLGEGRNVLVVRAADAVIAISGEFGTLSEIALALKFGRPVIGLGTWEFSKPHADTPDPVLRAGSPGQAVDMALTAAAGQVGSDGS